MAGGTPKEGPPGDKEDEEEMKAYVREQRVRTHAHSGLEAARRRPSADPRLAHLTVHALWRAGGRGKWSRAGPLRNRLEGPMPRAMTEAIS